MTTKDLINYMIPPLKPEDSIEKAQQWMDELKTTELPVTKEGRFLGLVDEDMTYDFLGASNVNDLPLKGQECSVSQDQHYYDVMSTAYNQGFRLVAVLDEEGGYLGVVSIQDVVEAFAQASSVNSSGAIMVLSIEEHDYSLSNISRMIEMNDVKVLSSHISSQLDESSRVRLTIKLDTEEISQVKTVLENNGINIEATFNTTALSYDEKERLDLLMKYLKP
ncbi:MAG: CBS domain-containing protein [Cytophagales bacterium]|nr:CBS domain-containing protein [Cytophagales bacterium]